MEHGSNPPVGSLEWQRQRCGLEVEQLEEQQEDHADARRRGLCRAGGVEYLTTLSVGSQMSIGSVPGPPITPNSPYQPHSQQALKMPPSPVSPLVPQALNDSTKTTFYTTLEANASAVSSADLTGNHSMRSAIAFDEAVEGGGDKRRTNCCLVASVPCCA